MTARWLLMLPAIFLPATVAAQQRHTAESESSPIVFNGLIQVWYAGGEGNLTNGFRLRRTELKFGAEVVRGVGWTIMVDPAKALSLETEQAGAEPEINQASRMLQDAYITVGRPDGPQVDVGQFKVLLSLEGLQSSATLETVERTLFASDRARGGHLADIRDIGVKVRGGLGRKVDYQFGVYNAAGLTQNAVARSDNLALSARLAVRPAIAEGLQLGGSGVWSNPDEPERPRRDRFGGDLLVATGPIVIKAELMAGWDGGIRRSGHYGHVGYRILPNLEAVGRIDYWNPDTRQDTAALDAAERDYIGGFNLFVEEHNAKLQVNVMRKTFVDGIVPAQSLLLVNVQTAW